MWVSRRKWFGAYTVDCRQNQRWGNEARSMSLLRSTTERLDLYLLNCHQWEPKSHWRSQCRCKTKNTAKTYLKNDTSSDVHNQAGLGSHSLEDIWKSLNPQRWQSTGIIGFWYWQWSHFRIPVGAKGGSSSFLMMKLFIPSQSFFIQYHAIIANMSPMFM